MKDVTVGADLTLELYTDDSFTAAAVGNDGVAVISTPALILMLENVSRDLLMPSYDAGEASVGTRVDVEHLAAAAAGTTVTVWARVRDVEGRRIGLDVEARAGDRVLMRGRHERFIVALDRFLKSQGLGPDGSGA